MTATSKLIVRPRITDFFDISVQQAQLDFAIPFLDQDLPLYVDPFLLWKSPSLQDQALHTAVLNSFNNLNYLLHTGEEDKAAEILILASECNEVGLGHSVRRRGLKIGKKKAGEILDLFKKIPHYEKYGFSHFEEIQLYVDDIAKDRISDICCNFIKSFLIDYTFQECGELGIPTADTVVENLYDYRLNEFKAKTSQKLPVNPQTGDPILFVPKRWLRFTPWINFDNYFSDYCPKDDIAGKAGGDDAVKILRYNRDHYDAVAEYIKIKERTKEDCKNDPLFKQIPITSSKRKFAELEKLPSGKTNNADQKYEAAAAQLLASYFYPDLDFADEQSRTDSGAQVRDLIFYNNRSVDFLKEIYEEYGSRQLVFEMKNVALIEREHINQLNRYLDSGLGKFGVFVTRNPLPKPMFKNTIDLWSGQRRCILALTDEDISLMTTIYESKQRNPIDVLKKKYIEFRRACPT